MCLQALSDCSRLTNNSSVCLLLVRVSGLATDTSSVAGSINTQTGAHQIIDKIRAKRQEANENQCRKSVESRVRRARTRVLSVGTSGAPTNNKSVIRLAGGARCGERLTGTCARAQKTSHRRSSAQKHCQKGYRMCCFEREKSAADV